MSETRYYVCDGEEVRDASDTAGGNNPHGVSLNEQEIVSALNAYEGETIELKGSVDFVEESVRYLKQESQEIVTEVAELRQVKDGAYRERNLLVSLLAALYPSALSRHPDEDTTWEDDWRWIVYLQTPSGQMSWHIHDSELSEFDHVKRVHWDWDGHSDDEKYNRLRAAREPNDA